MAMTKYKKAAEELYNPQRKQAISDALALRQQQAQDTRKIYDNQIFEEGRAYEDQYRENAVQKAINERQVAESMANLGLTDSGLNRTQQTAVQLSYANNKAGIDRQRQAGIDRLNLSKAQDLSQIRQNWLSDKATINQTYDNSIADTAEELYKKAISASKSGGENNKKVGIDGIIINNGSNLFDGMQGTLKDNNITMTTIVKDGLTTGYKYVDNNTGKSTTFSVGVNPFTGTNNKDTSLNTDTTKAYEKYEAFENGYQPKGIFYNGKDYGWVSYSGIKDYINGNLQNVHRTSDGSLWIWDRAQNRYRPYEE